MRRLLRRRARSVAPDQPAALPSGSGWRVADILDGEALAMLRALARAAVPEDLDSYYSTNVHASREEAVELDRSLKAVLDPVLPAALPGHRIFLSVVVAKGSETPGAVGFHQDWTFTDERRERAVLCWMPLVDTDDRSGAMRVVSGSHQWTNGVRPSGPDLPTDPFPEDLQVELGRRATTVPMRAGQGLIYDPALIHGSWPNAAPRSRLAVAAALLPNGASLIHLHDPGDRVVQAFEISDAHFTAKPFASMPEGPPLSPAWADAVTVDDIRVALEATA